MSQSDAFLERFLALHPKLIDLSLGRIERLLRALGDPHLALPPVIHVAGTNGKGSTVTFMRAILEAAGLSVHVYTSPHLVRFHERIRLGKKGGSEIIDEEMLVDAFERCEKANAGQEITFFEMTTAAAFLLFHENPADILLLEVGLGGRFDTTNVITDALATVITPISMDHSEYLGDTLEKIASAKAGIFKRRVPAVIAPQAYYEVEGVFEKEAARVGAPLFVAGQHFHIREENGRLVYEDEEGLLDLPLPRLPGKHQLINAGTAIAALRQAGFSDLPHEIFETGIQKAEWPARLQNLLSGQLAQHIPLGAELWLDGGHNPDGGKVLAQAMRDFDTRMKRPLVMIVGMLATKDSSGFLSSFSGLASHLFAIPVPDQKMARPNDEVAAMASQVGLQSEIASDVQDALAKIRAMPFAVAPRILIAGSLYLAGHILSANGTPPN
jgi:dihydrofolate synthase/folylpolyglutamate synthase